MPRNIEEIDNFWVDKELNRTLHVGFENDEWLYFDLFDTAKAAVASEAGKVLTAVFLNLKTGEIKVES